MRSFPSRLGRSPGRSWLLSLAPLLAHLVCSTRGVAYTPVQVPDLDLSQLGRVALTGDFDSISLYTYQQQTETSFSTNGTQSLISQLPNGDFTNVANADGYIKTLCPFTRHDGSLAGIIVGGNFTSLGGIQAQGVALYDPKSGQVTPLPGLTGQVNALLCDQDTDTVYVGGAFKGLNSTNAVAWVGMSGWANLPFEGFNGPVNSIIKSTNNTVFFGGSFSGLGNTTLPTKKNQQTINISSANISTSANSSSSGLSNPKNIICKSDGQDGPDNTWLLPDKSPGYWRADMNFGYEPSLLRIYNTHYQGRGAKTFRFTAMPINGIMNFTYTDADGKQAFCDARCPLSSDSSTPYQDFTFWNTVGMNGFQIDISEWYGEGAGLDGVELFENGMLRLSHVRRPVLIYLDMFAYAEQDLNEPTCANTSTPSDSSYTGPWKVTPSFQSNSRYLTADLTKGDGDSKNVSVVFRPDIQQKGNYSVLIYTPGCIQDNSCNSRGIVNVTGSYASKTVHGISLSTQIYQTNNYDKYDEIYRGPVDVSSDGFRPSVTLTPMSGQQGNALIVAQRVQFRLAMNSSEDGYGSGSLNGLFEFNPSSGAPLSDLSNSTFDAAGADLDMDALVTSIAITNGVTYVGGNFSQKSSGFENIFYIGPGNATSLPGGGLNAQVSTIFPFEDILYIGGNFTNTKTGNVPGLNNIAAYNTTSQTWVALAAGVNGPVNTIVGLDLNVTANQPEPCITFNGFFSQLTASGPNKAVDVQGFGVWVLSRQNWLQNLNLQSQSVNGQLSAMTNVSGGPPLLAGALSSQDMTARDAVYLTSNPSRLNGVNAGIIPKAAGPVARKRAIQGQNATGVVTGLFYNSNGRNITVLGGHFSATGSNGSTLDNLAFVDAQGKISGLTAGVDADSAFLSLATTGPSLYAGGSVTGSVGGSNVNGLIVYDLVQGDYSFPQPAALQGSDVAVNAITVKPKSQQVFVAGSFDSAGSLPCPSVCYFENGMWNQPGTGLSGVVNALTWQGNDKLLIGGNLTVQNNATTLANLDVSKSQFSVFSAASAIPGPVTALAPANNEASSFWVAGKSSNGSAFLMKYDGNSFHAVGDVLGSQTTIQGISVLQLGKNHDNNNLVSSGMVLLVTGVLDLPGFGNASAALFNGSTFTPFILSTSGNGPGSLSQLFSEKEVNFQSAGKHKTSTNLFFRMQANTIIPGGHLALGLVILVALACALGAIFLLVVAGILIERYRRRQEGYSPAPTRYFDKTSNMGRIPPEHLFGRLAQTRQAPQI